METHFPGTNEDQSQQARERVLEDIRRLISDAEALLRMTAADATDKAKEARAKLAAGLDEAKETYRNLHSQGMEAAKAAAGKADDVIRSHPYESLGIALGVGVVIGLLLRRK